MSSICNRAFAHFHNGLKWVKKKKHFKKFVYLFIYLFNYLFIYLSIYLFIYLLHLKLKKKLFLHFNWKQLVQCYQYSVNFFTKRCSLCYHRLFWSLVCTSYYQLKYLDFVYLAVIFVAIGNFYCVGIYYSVDFYQYIVLKSRVKVFFFFWFLFLF